MEDHNITAQSVAISPLPEYSRKKSILNLVVTVFLVLFAAGTAYLVSDFKFKSEKKSLETKIATLETENSTLKAENDNKSVVSMDLDNYAQYVKTKFSLDILRFWKIEEVFQSPINPNLFVYINLGGVVENTLSKFDASKINNYLMIDYPNIPLGNTYLISLNVPRENEFRGVDFDGEKFIFFETDAEDSPNPCHSRWLVLDLKSINISDDPITVEPYTISEQKRQEEITKEEECLSRLGD